MELSPTVLTRPAVKDSSNLSSLDLEPATASTPAQAVPIVKSTLMVNTKKHLSSANHFPANSRIFNRSLEQLQCQADAISSAYLTTTASNLGWGLEIYLWAENRYIL